jgi:oxygen-dependent protoporphyrinogen oxidase
MRRALGLAAEPALVHVTRWPHAIPQYVVGHKDRVARIDAALAAHPGLRLAGNWRGGIAMTECARNAAALADELARALPGQ